MSFECTSARRPADVGWVEEMIAKHRDLPTDKLVLVSQSGFTPQAEAKAAASKTLTLALTQVQEHPWAATLAELRRVFLLELRSSVFPYVGEAVRGQPVSPAARLRRGGTEVAVWQVADTLLAKPAVASKALEVASASPSMAIVIEFEAKPGLEAILSPETAIPVHRLSFVVQFHASRTEVPVDVGDLQGHGVLFGGAVKGNVKMHLSGLFTPDAPAKVVLTEYERGTITQRSLSAEWGIDLQPLADDVMRVVMNGPV